MNSRALMTTVPRIPQQKREACSAAALTSSALSAIRAHSASSPEDRSVAWQGRESDAMSLEEHDSPTLCLSIGICGRRQRRVPLHPGCDGVLMETPFSRNVSVVGHLSRIFPAPPRSLARCLSRALRHVDVLLRLRRPAGLGFQTKNLPAAAAPAGRDFFFGASAESTSRPWERGTLASLRAGVSRGQSGKYKQEK